ncbi:hypothetical protein Avbf_11783 [Armadillidium vulgare]|nr:hypothetical protein Avbf_11783 [Armadillidium vulgare]
MLKIEILFQNDTTFQNPPLELTLTDCSLECPLSDFINLLKDFIPKDWEKECHNIESYFLELIILQIHRIFVFYCKILSSFPVLFSVFRCGLLGDRI